MENNPAFLYGGVNLSILLFLSPPEAVSVSPVVQSSSPVRAYGKAGNGSGMKTGNGNWKRKWKCTNRWRAVLQMRKVGIAQDTAYRLEMVLCAAMEEGTERFVVITCVLLCLLSNEYMFSSRTCT